MFALFKRIFSRNWSLSNAKWFCSKKRKIGKGNFHLTKNQFDRNNNCCAEDIHSYMSNIVWKRILRFELSLKVIGKISIIKNFPQISHIHRNCNLSSIIVIFYTNCSYPMNFMAVEQYSFPILPVVSH